VYRIRHMMTATGLAMSLAGGGAGVALAQSAGSAPAAGQSGTASPSTVDLSDATVHKVGAALHRVTQIRHDYSQRAQAATMPTEQHALAQQAQTASIQAVQDQGLTVQQYDTVLRIAMNDPQLKDRLLKEASQTKE
jgi:hypothetical protein